MKCAFYGWKTTWTCSNHFGQQFNVICLYRPHRHVWVNDDSFSLSISLRINRTGVCFIRSKQILFGWMVVIPHARSNSYSYSLTHTTPQPRVRSLVRLIRWAFKGLYNYQSIEFWFSDSIQSNRKVDFLARKWNYFCWLFGWKWSNCFKLWKLGDTAMCHVAFETSLGLLNTLLVFVQEASIFLVDLKYI